MSKTLNAEMNGNLVCTRRAPSVCGFILCCVCMFDGYSFLLIMWDTQEITFFFFFFLAISYFFFLKMIFFMENVKWYGNVSTKFHG